MAAWDKVKEHVEQQWDSTIVTTLSDYIRIPNQSPDFDPEWASNGLMMKAFKVLMAWLEKQPLKDAKWELVDEEKRTPFLIVEVQPSPGDTTGKTALMYGHMDKQPPLLPWAEGLHPYEPVLRDGKLYGRGGADDGYALCAAVTAVIGLQQQGIPHGRIVIVIEACEESSSLDLPYYIEKFKSTIGTVDLVVCLDSGAANYDQLWVTTSLRGVIGGILTVEALHEGMHSGISGGVVPDSFNIIRTLVDRVEDSSTGFIKLQELHCEVPQQTREELSALEAIDFRSSFAALEGVALQGGDAASNTELAIRNFWKPCLTVTGADLPAPETAGNVVRKSASVKLSVRLPPIIPAVKATALLKETLESSPPFGAKVSFAAEEPGDGWAAPTLQPWLRKAVTEASEHYFKKPYGGVGIGGSIPFMGMLGEMFPEAQFVVTGVLGPNSNAHGPNEFLHIAFAKGVNYCVARVLAAHYENHVAQ